VRHRDPALRGQEGREAVAPEAFDSKNVADAGRYTRSRAIRRPGGGLPFAPLGFPSPGTARKAAGYRLYDR
jgi:hypothetical protein